MIVFGLCLWFFFGNTLATTKIMIILGICSMLAWLENREPNFALPKEQNLGKGRKRCPECGTSTRSNTLECKKCKYSFQASEDEKRTQRPIVWPGGLNKKRKPSSGPRKASAKKKKMPVAIDTKTLVFEKGNGIAVPQLPNNSNQYRRGAVLYSEL
jgi:hypothetical protein